MAASTAALRGITKQYKNFTLGPVDMTVPAGSIVGLIGENGAGKTTLLKILCGVNRADDGTVDLLGGSPADAATRAKIGVVFEDAFFYESFTAAQVARSLAGMYGARWNADSFSAYLRRWPMTPSCWCWTKPPPVLTRWCAVSCWTCFWSSSRTSGTALS